MPEKALFLDRDGVINQRLRGDYVRHPDEFIFEKNALQALRLLAQIFSPIVVVTNQAGIGKGRMTHADVRAVHEKMLAEIGRAGGRIDAVYYCPHRPEDGCSCRKPAPGMAYEAQRAFPRIAFAAAWMVGDSYSDMLMGDALGMRTALIAGKEEDATLLENFPVTGRFSSLWDFARYCEANMPQDKPA
ncbi:MAG: HAD family hydrolase [Saprospiraceae bacterium]|nr:HAD family hydrolase [Saprospiraceae bacterium]MDW8230819.1 HAD family hydrolase [Saprospiraceae bacterium]